MPDFDVLIVGAGAGGGVAAYALATRGLKVALLEKGRNPFPQLGRTPLRGSHFGDDEVKARRNFAFHDPFIEPRTFRQTSATTASVTAIQENGVAVGGGTNQYDGNSPRVQRADLKLKSTYGAVPGAAIEDWPLEYEDLVPYYELAEQLIGVQGLAGADPFAEPRRAYPMPPGAPTRACLLMAEGARSLGYHPHPMPIAINSVAYRGRPACQNAGFCNLGCPTNAKGSTAVTAVREALETGNLTVLSECCALAVETEPSGGRATGVRYLDGNGALQRVTATQVVLALNALETPRLLLASSSAAHPNGLGNGNDLVGRFLMFHVIFSAIGVWKDPIRSYRGRVSTHGMSDFTVPDGRPDWVRGGYVEMGGFIHPVAEGLQYPWPIHADFMKSGQYRNNISTVTVIGEDLPQASNRVDLDPTVEDVYGRAVARITYQRHAHDQAVIAYYLPKLSAIARAAGAESVLRFDDASLGGYQTKHLSGTTRMGRDPATSVCNEWGRLHGVDNVWIADGGVFPTSTAYNPTLTQQAMAWRTADRVAQELRP